MIVVSLPVGVSVVNLPDVGTRHTSELGAVRLFYSMFGPNHSSQTREFSGPPGPRSIIIGRLHCEGLMYFDENLHHAECGYPHVKLGCWGYPH